MKGRKLTLVPRRIICIVEAEDLAKAVKERHELNAPLGEITRPRPFEAPLNTVSTKSISCQFNTVSLRPTRVEKKATDFLLILDGPIYFII